MDIKECIRKGFVSKMGPDMKLVEKELKSAEYDLSRAKDSIKDGDFKWAIIQSYYSMFHAARALLFAIGLKERRHFAVQVVLEELHKKGEIESVFINTFSAAMEAREDADYRYLYSKETAEDMLESAIKFLEKMRLKANEFISQRKNMDD